ncbi:MAG TPA: hypothetical protein P5016_05720 [Verrucomicrobiales bacterium]|nr:hypothetical protein [Verrucomicrobiae bacterium]MCP5552139.1 hypothetical protein [Akkermansiaceae bacterium]HRX53985.1 hypothetical protein [Verrucomicrobiales bacterium]
MKKFVMFLSILAMAGSAALGVLNQKTFETERTLLAQAKDDLVKTSNEVNQEKENKKNKEEERTQKQDERDKLSAEVAAIETDIKRQKKEIADSEDTLKKNNIELQEIALVISKIGDFKNVDELKAKQEAQKQQIADLETKRTDNETKFAAAMVEVGKSEEKAKILIQKEIEYKQAIVRSGMEATVIAVNRDYGFVVVNVGKNLGVKGDAALLVKRGTDSVARLQITSIEPNMLVANIVPGSLAEGARVVPGDKVIFDLSN